MRPPALEDAQVASSVCGHSSFSPPSCPSLLYSSTSLGLGRKFARSVPSVPVPSVPNSCRPNWTPSLLALVAADVPVRIFLRRAASEFSSSSSTLIALAVAPTPSERRAASGEYLLPFDVFHVCSCWTCHRLSLYFYFFGSTLSLTSFIASCRYVKCMLLLVLSPVSHSTYFVGSTHSFFHDLFHDAGIPVCITRPRQCLINARGLEL